MIDDQEPSQERTRFAILPAVAVHDSRLSHAALRVLAVLSSYSDRDGWSWPKQADMAETLGVTRQAIQQHIAKLDELGYIEVERRFYEHGGQRSSRYRLIYDRWGHARLQGEQAGLAGGASRSDGDSKPDLQGEQDRLAVNAGRRPETTGTRPPEQDHENRNGAVAAARPVGNARVQRFIDESRRLNHQWATNARDLAAIKETTAEPEEIAQAYWSLVARQWGTDWQQKNASVRLAIEHLAVYRREHARAAEYNQFSQVVDLTNQPPVEPGDLEDIKF